MRKPNPVWAFFTEKDLSLLDVCIIMTVADIIRCGVKAVF